MKYCIKHEIERMYIPHECRKPIYNLFKLLRIKPPKMDNNTPKIISDKYKFIYIGNPLVASTSFRDGLVRNSQEDYVARIEYFEITDDYEDYFKFSFVRNPLTRVVSCYNKKIWNTFALGLLYLYGRHRGFKINFTFEEFVDWLCTENGSDKYADRHWLSQSKILYDESGKCLCDFIGKIENLNNDLKKVEKEIGINITLPKSNTSQSRPKKPKYGDYKEYYDENLIKKVYWRYKDDFEIFNYDIKSVIGGVV